MLKFIMPTLALALTSLLSSPLYGAPISGTVTGQWSNPILSGNLILTDGSTAFFDNSTTAVFSVLNVTDGSGPSTFSSGAFPDGSQPFSFLSFAGATLSNAPLNTPVLLGRLTYINGTSSLDSITFGATLTLSVLNLPTVLPLVATANLLTTQNTGTDPFFDADFLSLDVLFPASFNVFEGQTATADLFGRFVGNDQLQLTSIQLSPGETGGFIGGGATTTIPEPSTLAASLIGLAGLALYARKRQQGL